MADNQNQITQDDVNAFMSAGGVSAGKPAPVPTSGGQVTDDDAKAFMAIKSPTEQQGTERPGYFPGLWKTTVGPLLNLGRDMSDYYNKKGISAKALADPTGGAVSLLVDAANDKEHPLHKVATGLWQSHVDTAKKAYQKGQEAVTAAKQGDYWEAGKALSEATGYGVATALPAIGPAAAQTGDKLAQGIQTYKSGKAMGSENLQNEGIQQIKEALGETTGLVVSVMAPEAVKGAAGKVVGKVAPKTAEIAGESIPVRASQESGVAGALENVAPSKTLSKFDIEQTQPAARRAIGKVASEVESKPIAGQQLPAVAKDLGERVEQIEAQSQPVFKKLDQLSEADVKAGNIKTKFSDLQKAEKSAYRKGDYEAVAEAKAQQQALMDRYADQFDPTDLSNARANWRQARALAKVDVALNKTVGPTPVEFRIKGAPDPGYINGKAFSKKIMDLKEKGTLEAVGLTPEHIQSLQDLGTLLEKSANVHKLNALLKAGGEVGSLGYVLTYPAAIAATAKVAAPAYIASRALGRIMTDAGAADAVVQALQAGAQVGRATSIAAEPAYGATKDILSGPENE